MHHFLGPATTLTAQSGPLVSSYQLSLVQAVLQTGLYTTLTPARADTE